MWLAVASQDREPALRVLQSHWDLAAGEHGRRADANVIDLDASQHTCPACETVFAAGLARCPGCGLRLG